MARLRDMCSRMTRANLFVLTGAVGALALTLALLGSVALSQTKATVPKFEVDPWWPKPLPEGWITGRLGTVCVGSWDGDWDKLPGVIHGCYADRDNNIWLTGNGDGIIQKYTHDGKLLLQIG